ARPRPARDARTNPRRVYAEPRGTPRGMAESPNFQGPVGQHSGGLAALGRRRSHVPHDRARARRAGGAPRGGGRMALKKPHNEWRLPQASTLDVRAVGLDELLTRLWLRVIAQNRPL